MSSITDLHGNPVTPGVRIRLIEMPHDPCPIPPGSTGTVRAIRNPGTPLAQLDLLWDEPRSLMLLPGVDRFELTQ